MATTQWSLKALKQLRVFPLRDQDAVNKDVKSLESWPDCRNVKALANRSDYRLRVGRYRVFFCVRQNGTMVIIQVEEVKKRDERTY